MLFNSIAPASALDSTRTHCPEITTCAEAYYKLDECGHSERDNDKDGIPCETVCGKDLETAKKRSLVQWPKGLPFISSLKPDGGGGLGIIPPVHAELPNAGSADAFSCSSSKKTCKQMLSCDEATFHLKNCGQSKLDGDGDGVACNNLCK